MRAMWLSQSAPVDLKLRAGGSIWARFAILREKNQQHTRGKAKSPNRKAPASHGATATNQVWSWDITYLTSPVRGKYYYLYMIVDIFSRYIVGWEVHEEESGEPLWRAISA